jgi:hypothetical protein
LLLGALAGLAAPAAAQQTTPPTPTLPFAFADFTWLNGNSRQHAPVFDSPFVTGEVRFDVNYAFSFNHPRDHSLTGSCETGRTDEIQLQQLGLGGDLHVGHVRGRVMTQLGMYSTMTPRNDPSPQRGQWDLTSGYRYLSEAYGGYHWDAIHGINLDAGIFMSYVGLFSYYNFDNWAYQPSYVSANTPWFFNGLRLQTFPTDRLKVELWVTNGWQSYGMFNEQPGLGTQILWRPNAALSFLTNDYAGADTPGLPGRQRVHTDNSIQVRYLDRPGHFVDRAAFSITADAGCEHGGGAHCGSGADAQYFLGGMLYDRTWLSRDRVGITLGAGAISNPGRYLVLVPPVNGATAASGTPYFTQRPGESFRAWDTSATVDLMPDESTTFRLEVIHRAANAPYFAGPGGLTPPGGNSGAPGSVVPGFTPDLRDHETRLTAALLIKL